MASRGQRLLRQATRRLWFRPALFSLLGVASALLAIFLTPYIPDDLPGKIGAEAVDSILTIIATSMLTVTTFSLSTMVAAYAAATNSVTPRATKLLIEDTTTQNVLASFIGSFLFSLVGIIALSTGVYGANGRVVLFVATIAVIILIVATLLRWIDHLSRLGRVEETTRKVEEAASEAMRARKERPWLGGAALRDVPARATAISSPVIGYIQHVDVAALSTCATANKGRVYVAALPGAFTDTRRPLAWFHGDTGGGDLASSIADAFTIADARSFEQDPRFGLSVLSEIASRALSPAMNDPGTAIDVIGRAVRILAIWAENGARHEIEHPDVFVPPVLIGDLFDDIFNAIARDGASMAEVQIRLQKAFRMLSAIGGEQYERHARRHAALAWERAEKALTAEPDRAAVKAAMAW